MELSLTEEQTAAYEKVIEWVCNSPQGSIFRLGGYAGTGKTTLLGKIVADLERMEVHDCGDMMICAFTNKAASVLRSKGISTATTIHSILYKPKTEHYKDLIKSHKEKMAELLPGAERLALQIQLNKLEEEYRQVQKAGLEEDDKRKLEFHVADNPAAEDAELVIIDEASMVNRKIMQDLQDASDAKILLCGDPAQLPPVEGDSDFQSGIMDSQLVEVQRVETHAWALREFAMQVRSSTTGEIDFPIPRDGSVVTRNMPERDDILAADKILCGTNLQRHRMNQFYRLENGFHGAYPQEGETIIALLTDKRHGIYNGVCYKVAEVKYEQGWSIVMDLVEDGADEVTHPDISVNKRIFDKLAGSKMDNALAKALNMGLQKGDFDFGYCLTVHKAQGSEWPKVMVVDDARWMKKQRDGSRQKWLYTAVTRPSRELVYVG